MNHYPRHLGDWLKKTIGLTMLQDGAYNRMVDLYYNEERPLPLDKTDLYASLRCRDKSDRDAVDYCLRKFFTKEDDGFHHDRCDEELAKYADKSAKAAKSASARWGDAHIERNANAMRTHSDGNAKAMLTNNQEPVTSNQEPIKAKSKAKTRGDTPSAYSPPDWIPPQAWADFVEHRKVGKKAMTPRAMELAVDALDALRRTGSDPGDVLNQSVQNGWTSLFPIKRIATVTNLSPAGEATARNLQRWLENEEAKDAAVGS